YGSSRCKSRPCPPESRLWWRYRHRNWFGQHILLQPLPLIFPIRRLQATDKLCFFGRGPIREYGQVFLQEGPAGFALGDVRNDLIDFRRTLAGGNLLEQLLFRTGGDFLFHLNGLRYAACGAYSWKLGNHCIRNNERRGSAATSVRSSRRVSLVLLLSRTDGGFNSSLATLDGQTRRNPVFTAICR